MVADLPGVETVTTKLVPSNAKEAKACQNIAAKLGRLNKGQGISFAGASMTSAGSAALRSATQLLSNCRIVTIRVVGHTDGSVINGSELSLRRANIVRKALIAGGVDKERITASGFADAYPALRADSARARALNNRVTIDVQE
ncbi:MAG: OmpA family protein [Nocardioidaceae bacterium]|nr:MAG: OmpA family protein [Nocardioidaceae bacterium]